MAMSFSSLRILGYRINAVAILASLFILFWAAMALFGTAFAPYSPGKVVDFDYYGPISADFLLGTDYLGRDILSRILMGRATRSASRWRRCAWPASPVWCSAWRQQSPAAGSMSRSAGSSMR